MLDGPPLLKERRHLQKVSAEQMWKSLQHQGWRPTKPVWGAGVEPLIGCQCQLSTLAENSHWRNEAKSSFGEKPGEDLLFRSQPRCPCPPIPDSQPFTGDFLESKNDQKRHCRSRYFAPYLLCADMGSPSTRDDLGRAIRVLAEPSLLRERSREALFCATKF